MKSKELYLVQLCLHIQYYIIYISGWKMFFNNRILLGNGIGICYSSTWCLFQTQK